jgi:hypothetical protein
VLKKLRKFYIDWLRKKNWKNIRSNSCSISNPFLCLSSKWRYAP